MMMQERPKLAGIHWQSIIQLLISGVGTLLYFAAALGAMVFTFIALLEGNSGVELRSLTTITWSTMLLGFLMLPSLVLAIARMRKKELPETNHHLMFRLSSISLFFVPVLLVAGEFLARNRDLAWLLLPPLQFFVLIIPIWWIIETGSRNLNGISLQRFWGIISFGLVVTPIVVFLLEILALAVVFLGGGVWLSTQSSMLEEINLLMQRLLISNMNPEVLDRIMRVYLQNPVVIIGILAVGAGIVPLIEEFFKPLAMWGWRFSIRKITPSEGFVAGLVSGATFALLESTGMLASPLEQGWAVLAIGRLGTAFLHISTAALMGWGLASAWSHKEYLRLLCAFLLAVFLHGIWNVFSLLMGVSEYLAADITGVFFQRLAQIAPFALIFLVAVFLLIIVGGNLILRKTNDDPQAETVLS